MLQQHHYDETRTTSSQGAAQACQLIRGCIQAVRWPLQQDSETTPIPLGPRSSIEEFSYDVRSWLTSVRNASGKGWRPDDAWHYAFRQHLALIVGPNARSPLGRAAGQEGHRMLALEFRALFGRVDPPQPPSILNASEEAESQRVERELVATFHALPDRLRQDKRLVPRLLGVVVRIATKVPQGLLNAESAGHLSRLQQLTAVGVSESSPPAARPRRSADGMEEGHACSALRRTAAGISSSRSL
jgi:hypothetical protein